MSLESSAGESKPSDSAPDATPADADPAVLSTRLELLREENRRLRDSYARARRSEYRRTALGFLAIGLLAALGALLMPPARTVLFALAGTGLFAAVLVYYLTPERFVAASVGEGVYDARAATGDALVAELGLTDDRLYVPTAGEDPARLYVPQHATFEVPDDDALDALFVVTDDEDERGVSLMPTGAALFSEFERSLPGALADASDSGTLATQLADGVVETLELARSVRAESAVGDDGAHGDGDTDVLTLSFGVAGATPGSLDRFDHPVVSFLAVGAAVGCDAPVSVTVAESDDDRSEFVVTCAVRA